VREIQRVRILAAMSELVRERGPGAVTVAQIVARSGVSRRTFYELFEDRDACLLAAFDQAVQCATAAVLPRYRTASGPWEERIRSALAALLCFLEDEPALGGLLVVDSLAAGRSVLDYRARIVDVLVDAVHRGSRPQGRGAPRARKIVAEGVVGAVLSVIHARLREPGPKPLASLLNPLMGIVVLPYLGPDAVGHELTRPALRARRRAPAAGDPLRELHMRLTYRTVRVLLAIADLGGWGSNPSGRQIADASGISDQGQMSKLLARLEHLGLIHNEAGGRGKGQPNAWTLTARGRSVERAVRAQGDG
jgi:AcrR family transcriptional regulator